MFSELYTDEEKKFLKESQYYESGLSSPFWQKLKKQMQALVDEGSDDLKRNTDPSKDTPIRMRWQQRGYMMDSLILHCEETVKLRKELLARAKETTDVEHDSYTF